MKPDFIKSLTFNHCLFFQGEIIKNQDTGSLPFPMILSGTVVTSLWLLYGIILENNFIIVSYFNWITKIYENLQCILSWNDVVTYFNVVPLSHFSGTKFGWYDSFSHTTLSLRHLPFEKLQKSGLS